MKKFSALLLALGFCLMAVAKSATFNVATYNLRNANDHDRANGNGWEQRLPNIAKLVQFHEFDIFGTQEAFKSQIDDMLKLLPNYAYIGVAREDGKENGEHSAIFYRKDLFDLLDHGDFWLSEHPEKPGLGWDAACVRICTWGKFRHKATGKKFLFFNLHMDHVGTTARIESAKLIKKQMKKFGSKLPTFLTGDFNVDQTESSYRTIISDGKLLDSYSVSDMVYAPNGTFNDYATDDYTESRIDHIFVTPNVHVNRYGILTDTYRSQEIAPDGTRTVKARTPSDHFPVEVEVTIK